MASGGPNSCTRQALIKAASALDTASRVKTVVILESPGYQKGGLQSDAQLSTQRRVRRSPSLQLNF
jgi:hypothetical protein